MWLFVVGATGLILGNPEWRWPHQIIVPWLSVPVDELGRQHIRHPRDWVGQLAIDPSNEQHVLSGGVGGLWLSTDRAASWQPVAFEGERRTPQILQIATDSQGGWSPLLLATDDGIWRFDPQRRAAQRYALAGERITSLQIHPWTNSVIGVMQRTILFRFPLDAPLQVRLRRPAAIPVAGVPATTTLAKYGFDLHAVAGLPSLPISKAVNDYAGIALPVLCVSGFLFWYLPRPRVRAGRRIPARVPVNVMRWLFRVHVFLAGLLVLIPLLYLGATGIAMGHKFGFSAWAKKIDLNSSSLTGNYDLRTLNDELITVFAPSADPDHLTALTRLGGLVSSDGGETWVYDHSFPLKLMNYWAQARYRMVSGYEFVSDEGNRLFTRRAGATEWIRHDAKAFGLLLDARRVGSAVYLYTWYGSFRGDPESGFSSVALPPAPLNGLDMAFLARVIHGLLIYHSVLVWFNDFGAVSLVLLALTGLIIWLARSKKWM